MSIKFHRKHSRGFTLIEIMTVVGLFGLVSLALASIFFFSIRSFASMANYAELDKINRTALDTMTAEIRQAKLVVAASSNSITIINGDLVSVTYSFNQSLGKLQRIVSSGTSKDMLSSCTLLSFNLYQRNPATNQYDLVPTTNPSDVKGVSLTWKSSRPIVGGPSVSENIQTALVVIRKEQN